MRQILFMLGGNSVADFEPFADMERKINMMDWGRNSLLPGEAWKK
jgi:hypothetical protein